MEWLHDWFATPAGRDLAARESRLLSRRLAGLYARRVLQLGAYGGGFCPTVYGDARQWVMDDWPGGPIDLRAERTVIPLASGSVDVVILVISLSSATARIRYFAKPLGSLLRKGIFWFWGSILSVYGGCAGCCRELLAGPRGAGVISAPGE